MGKRTVRVTWLEHRRRKSPRVVEELCRPFFTVKGVFRVHLGDISVSGQQSGELFVSCRHIYLVGLQAAGVFAEGLTSEECPHYFGCSVRKKTEFLLFLRLYKACLLTVVGISYRLSGGRLAHTRQYARLERARSIETCLSWSRGRGGDGGMCGKR